MLRGLIFASGLALAACSPAEQVEAPVAEQAAVGEAISFMAPSGNVGCTYVPAGGTAVYETLDGAAELSCDRIAPAYVRIVLPEHGAAVLHEQVGDASCCSGETLSADDDWSDGPFQCDVSEDAIACTSRERHGFVLSRTQTSTR